jgi:hypothetical protein
VSDSGFAITFPSIEAAVSALGQRVFGVGIVIEDPSATPEAQAPQGPTADHSDIAEFLYDIGWTSPNDAQWNRLKDAFPRLQSMLGCQVSPEPAQAPPAPAYAMENPLHKIVEQMDLMGGEFVRRLSLRNARRRWRELSEDHRGLSRHHRPIRRIRQQRPQGTTSRTSRAMSEPDERDDDYSMELYIERFRRDHPTWTEEEIEAYLHQSDPE